MSTTRASRPVRDKSTKSQPTENSHHQSESQANTKNQPTAEQMRMAQMITTDNKGEDPEVQNKILKVIELTGRSEDDALFALYDVNYDLARAVEKLLENSDTQNEWHEISKKKKPQPAAKLEPIINNKSDINKREKSHDRERDYDKPDNSAPRNRRERGPPRFQRGRGRERGGSDDDRNRRDGSGERSYDRGERGSRGRGRGGGPSRGRGRGRGSNFRGTRFDNNKFDSGNVPSSDQGPHIDTWTNEQAQPEKQENIGSWGDMAEDWSTDEWQGSLEESKVFTPSMTNDGSMFTPQMNDNDASMFNAGASSLETQVFSASSLSNSNVSPALNDSSNAYAQHGSSPLQQNAIGHNAMGQNAMTQNSIDRNSIGASSLGQRLNLGDLFPKVAETSNAMSQPQSQYMSQYAKEATESIKNAVGIGSGSAGPTGSLSNDVSRSMVPSGLTHSHPHSGQPSLNQQQTIQQQSMGQQTLQQQSMGQQTLQQSMGQQSMSQQSMGQQSLQQQSMSQQSLQQQSMAQQSLQQQSMAQQSLQQQSMGQQALQQQSLNPQILQQQAMQQQRPKQPQRSKLPPPSKIPASAVEMPGGMNFQLDVQFGNWADYPNASSGDNTTNGGLGFGSINSVNGTVNNSYSQPPASVTPTKPQQASGMSGLDGLGQNSQSPRASNMYNPSAASSATPPKDYSQNQEYGQSKDYSQTKDYSQAQDYSQTKDYSQAKDYGQSKEYSQGKDYNSQTGLVQSAAAAAAAITTPPRAPDPIPFPNPQADRKQSPYGSQRAGAASGSMSSNKPSVSPMAYSQSEPNYSSSYPSSAYATSKPAVTSTSSYSHSSDSLPSQISSHQSSLQSQSYNQGYQSSFQNQGSYSTGSSQNAGGSLYQNSQSNYTSGGAGSSYSGASGAYQASQNYQSPSGASSGYNSQSYSSRGETGGQSGGSYQGSSSTGGYQGPVSSAPTSSTYQQQTAGQSSYQQSPYGTPASHQNSLNSSKLSDSLNKMSINDSSLESQNAMAQYEQVPSSGVTATTLTTTTASPLASGGVSVSAVSLGLSSATTTPSTALPKNALPITTKAPPNLPPGVPLMQNYMTIGQPGIAPFAFAGLAAQQPMYSYEDLQLLQQSQRIAMPGFHGYQQYDMPLQPTTTLAGVRDQSAALASVPYSSPASTEASMKLTRVDAQSPPNAQNSQQQPSQSAHQQAYINPSAPLPPGYNYYYPSAGVLPGGYTYPPTMFPVPSVTNPAHGGTTASIQYQKPGAYGSHAYGQSQDFTKGYSGVSSVQTKGTSGSMAVSTSATDLTGTGTNYGKAHTQTFDKGGFHAGTPPPFTLPSLPSGSQAGPMGAPAAYGAQYVPVMAHQPHSQLLHHQLQQDTAGGAGRSSQAASQNKQNINKGAYSAYWGAN